MLPDASPSVDPRAAIPGCVSFRLGPISDGRGWFRKVYQRSAFSEMGLDPMVAEVFLTASGRGVVRGLHLQVPPDAHTKTVCCISGAIFDVVLDLRVGSPTYGRHAVAPLSGENGDAIHVPIGCAHGFQALTDDAIVAYLVSTEHAPDFDTGVRFDSAGIQWPLAVGEISERDRTLPSLETFTSPFRFDS